MLDRIDMRVEVLRVAVDEMVRATVVGADVVGADVVGAAAAALEDPVAQVRAARERRLSASGALSARLSVPQLRACCALSAAGERLLRSSCQRLGLSGRGVHRMLMVGRTIADLDGSARIEPAHLAEAIALRRPSAIGGGR